MMSKRKNEQGFTLIELLIVIIIVGILAAIAIPMFLNQRTKAKDAAVKGGTHNIEVGVMAYGVDRDDSYPAAANPTVLRDLNGVSYIDNWPLNPYTGDIMAQDDGAGGRVEGGYTYELAGIPVGTGFQLSGHLSDGREFVVR